MPEASTVQVEVTGTCTVDSGGAACCSVDVGMLPQAPRDLIHWRSSTSRALMARLLSSTTSASGSRAKGRTDGGDGIAVGSTLEAVADPMPSSASMNARGAAAPRGGEPASAGESTAAAATGGGLAAGWRAATATAGDSTAAAATGGEGARAGTSWSMVSAPRQFHEAREAGGAAAGTGTPVSATPACA